MQKNAKLWLIFQVKCILWFFFIEWHNNQWSLPMWGETETPVLNINNISKITANYHHVLQYRVPFFLKKTFLKTNFCAKEKWTKHKSFHEVDTNFGTKKKVEICLQSRCLFLLPYTVVKRYKKICTPLAHCALLFFVKWIEISKKLAALA